MAIIDTLGGNDNPMFLTYSRSGGLDVSPAVKYADFAYQAKKLAKEEAKKLVKDELSELGTSDIKDAISQDMAVVEGERRQGMKEMKDLFVKYGNNYLFAMTDPKFKEAYWKMNVNPVEILQLKEHKLKAEDFTKKVADLAAGQQAFTAGQGYMGAMWDPTTKSWLTNADAIRKRYYDPNWNYRNAPGLVMTSDFADAKYAQDEIKGLFDKVKVSTHGGEEQELKELTFNAIPGDDSSATAARLLQSVYTSGGSNTKALNDAVNFFVENISQKALAGLFNEFKDSPQFYSQFGEDIKNGTFSDAEAKRYFREQYVPQYVSDLAKSYVQTMSDRKITTQILDSDIMDAKNIALQKNMANAISLYAGASEAVFGNIMQNSRNQNVTMSRGVDEDGNEIANVVPVTVKKVNMDEKTKEFLNNVINNSKDDDGDPTLRSDAFGKAGLTSLNGTPVNLSDWAMKYGAKIVSITSEVTAMPIPNMNKNGEFSSEKLYDLTGQYDDKGNAIVKNDYKGFITVIVKLPNDYLENVNIAQMDEDTGNYTMQHIESPWRFSWDLGIDAVKEELVDSGAIGDDGDYAYIPVMVPISGTNAMDLVNPFKPSEFNVKLNELTKKQVADQQYLELLKNKHNIILEKNTFQ